MNEQEETKLLNQFSKRMQHLQQTHSALTNQHKQQQADIERQQKLFSQDMAQIKEMYEDVSKIVSQLHNALLQISTVLKEKIPQKEFEELKNRIDAWPLEAFMTHKELEPRFSLYSKR